jgi:ubiquitin-conjugating enzyme E2 J2
MEVSVLLLWNILIRATAYYSFYSTVHQTNASARPSSCFVTHSPMWSVSTILTGLYSFMLDSHPTSGSIETTTMQKRKLAAQSLDYNARDKVFCELFPQYVELHQERVAARRLANPESPSNAATSSSSSTLDHPNGHNLNTLLTATAGLVALVSIALAMLSYFF